MAVQEHRTCDVGVKKGRSTAPCGKPAANNKPTVMSVDSAPYQSDLCDEHRAPYVAMFDEFKAVGVRVVTSGPAGKRSTQRTGSHTWTTKQIRDWLKGQGRAVSPTGRLSQTVIEEYLAAQSNGSSARMPAPEPQTVP